jgi:hypothetical protein
MHLRPHDVPLSLTAWARRHVLNDERLNSARFLLFFWFGARFLALGIWALIPSAQGDVYYYYDRMALLADLGPAQLAAEYPTPALFFLYIPYILGLGSARGYIIAFVLVMVALDAAFTYSLWLKSGHMRGLAVIFWTSFLGLIGPVAYLRFDLVTSVLCGWALMFLMRHHAWMAGVMIGLGASFKLWPALLWGALCGSDKKHNLKVTFGIGLTGATLAGISLLWGGWDRLLSPLSYQTDRGLQVESVWATVPMLLRAAGQGDFVVAISRYQAFEVWGTSTSFWASAADVAALVGYAVIAAASLAFALRGRGRMMESCALVLLFITVLIVANKTFSPQYVIWLGAPAAAMFTVLGGGDEPPSTGTLHRYTQPASGLQTVARGTNTYAADWRHVKRIAIIILVVCGLTTVIFPIGYGALVNEAGDWVLLSVRGLLTCVLALRNTLVVALLVELVRWVWSFTNPDVWVPHQDDGSPETLSIPTSPTSLSVPHTASSTTPNTTETVDA